MTWYSKPQFPSLQKVPDISESFFKFTPSQIGLLIILQTYITHCCHDTFACADAPAWVSLFPSSSLFNRSQDPAYLSSQVNKHSLIQMDQNGQSSLPPVNTLDVIHLSFIFSPVLKWPIILCISKCSLTAQTSSTSMLFISHTGHIQSGYFC